jgi:hypothetical protein
MLAEERVDGLFLIDKFFHVFILHVSDILLGVICEDTCGRHNREGEGTRFQ